MADAITIKALQDASLDAKSLEEVVNGNDAKQVTTRLGETYPSVKKAIKTLFENGGLPATPFASKALMTASALVDGKYAMVTDDTVNNGLYVKTAGAWVKSAYDPVSIVKNSTSGSGYYKEVPYTLLGDGYLDANNALVASAAMGNTDYIPVTKGDYLVLENIRNALGHKANFLLYSPTKEFVGAMYFAQNYNDNYPNDNTMMLSGGGVYSSKQNLFNVGAIIPSTGFIKLNIVKDTQPYNKLNLNQLNTRLVKTDFEGFVKKTVFAINEPSLKSYEKTLSNAVIDVSLIGSSINAGQVVGSPVSIRASAGSSYNIFKKIPVVAGQYFHYQTLSNTTDRMFVVVDASNKVIQLESNFNEFSATASTSLRFFNNIYIKQDGFVLLQQFTVGAASGVMYAVTENKVNIQTNYLSNNTQIDFYPSLGVESGINFGTSYNRVNLSTLGYSVNDASKAIYTTSIPYVLKKGDVLEYSLDATSSPLLAIVMPRNLAIVKNIRDAVLAVSLIANEVVDESQVAAWRSNNKDYTPLFFSQASKGTVAYCNEDSDSVVIFIRPVSESNTFKTFKQSTKYTMSILTKTQYIEKRNKALESRFNIKSAMSPNGSALSLFFDGSGYGYVSMPSVLLFKGEVLNYMTSVLSNVVATNLNLMSGAKVGSEIIENISRLRKLNGANLALVKNLSVDVNNPMSCFKDQVYAHETCVVYPSYYKYNEVDHKNLDATNTVSSNFFKPRIVNIEDVVIGDNIEASYLPAFSVEPTKNVVDGVKYLSVTTSFARECIFSFSPKDTCVEAIGWSARTIIGLVVVDLKPTTNLLLNPVAPYAKLNEDGETYFNDSTWASPYKIGYKLQSHSLISVCCDVKTRDATALLSDGSINLGDIFIDLGLNGYPLMPYLYEHGLKTISEADYKLKYKVTSETQLKLPITKNLNFNYCNTVGAGILPTETLLQIRAGDKVLAVLNVLTENQGQSTAASVRRNVNTEFFNDKWEEVLVKFGGEKPEQEMVLKSYINSDRCHFQEVSSTNLWHDIRTSEPYPKGGVIPANVFSDMSVPLNQEARGTTFGFPVEQFRAEKFYSLGTVRNKKKRDNYGMKSSDRSHILIQADHQAMGVINWSDVQFGNFEVRNPKIKGYTEADKTLPAGWEDVEGNINRLLAWMKGCYNGTIDMTATYKDFIDLDSFIDYCVAITVAWNWDGVKNNFLLGTYDSNIWRVFWYDSDQTWGAIGSGGKIPYYNMDSVNFFTTLMNKFPNVVKKRYARLRQLGIIDARDLQDKMLELATTHHIDSKKLDVKYWGDVFESATAPYSMGWVDKRINYLDAVYGYVSSDKPDVVSQTVFAATTLVAGQVRNFSIANTKSVVGDLLTAVLGEKYPELSFSASPSANGTVTLTITNTGATGVSISQTYLTITKGL